MKAFLKDYWPWIVVPFALVVGGLTLAWLMIDDGGASPFVYNID